MASLRAGRSSPDGWCCERNVANASQLMLVVLTGYRLTEPYR